MLVQEYVFNTKNEFHNLQPVNKRHRGYLFFSMKDRNLFHRVDIGNIFMSGAATS